ncbi:swi5-dependent recombination DNA repair protein 1 homolog [Plakobranchus ocellatus]|uniref:Swi5-dependent recombination DNA repair protein 1 homolog n=1 Tax=Plakobranchus ocellatus TaxID=259542 RepID=A0AAV3Z9S2_9GAST|nr:swi5-dependent recombination DNA repair protein 1 homolog [Plakobranchus ocellatus]
MNRNVTPLRASHSKVSSQMSSSLRERLKRCGRYHPCSPNSIPQASQNPSLADHDESGSPTREVNKVSSSFSHGARSNLAKGKVNLLMEKSVCESVEINAVSSDEQLSSQKREIVKICKENQHKITVSPAVHGSLVNNVANSYISPPIPEQKSCDCLDRDNVSHQRNSPSVNYEKQLKNDSVSSKSSLEHSDHWTKPPHGPSNNFTSRNSLSLQLQDMDSALEEKLELLRKLKMVKMYREKNNLTNLQQLIDRWRSVSQSALTDLLDLQPEPRPSMENLISHLQIDPNLVLYDEEEQDFK